MKSFNKLHLKISSKTVIAVTLLIVLLAVIFFYFAIREIRDEYFQRLELPGKLIEKNVVSYEIINDRDFIISIVGEDIVHCAIIGTDNKIYYSILKNMIGKDAWNIQDINTSENQKSKWFPRIKDKIKYFTSETPLYNNNKETLGYLFIKTKKTNFRNDIKQLFFIFILGLILILGILFFIISRLIRKKVTNHLDRLLESTKEINQGNLSHIIKQEKTNDELDLLEGYCNHFVIGLREKTNFALEIEKKNFDYTYTPLSDKDELGKALVELRNSLKKATEEELVRKNSDEINNWISNGVAKFSEILRKDIENMEQLGYSVISNMVEYLGANQGGFFLIEEDSFSGEKIIELKAAYALNRKKHYQKKLALGEGLIGATIMEKKPTYLTNLPDDYINISSGLGEAKPKALLIVPLISDDMDFGAFEIASFKEFEKHQMDFINRVTEIITSTIYTVRNNIRTQHLLKESQEQAERIKQAEEELRQNMEEMHATQEEVERTNEQLKHNEEVLRKQAEELAKEKYLMDALMFNLPDYIYFKDKNSKFIKNSRSHARCFGFEDPAEIVGKSDFDFFSEEHSRPAFNDEQNIIKTGKPMIDVIEKETHSDGSVTWVTTTKMPLRDQHGKIVGTFGISKDITSIKKLEQEAIKSKEKLEFENILFTTLMDHITARITYKDTDAKYLRINKTKMKALGVKNQEEIIGKNDMDIFGDSHGKEFIEKEINNIKSGLTILNNEELIKYKDGRRSWGSTSRIPLKDKEGKILGGLVITWDITEKKDAMFDLEMNKEIIKEIFKEMPIVFYQTDSDLNITDIFGKGLKLLDLKGKREAMADFKTIFPELFKKISKHTGEEPVEYVIDVKMKNDSYNVRHVVFPNKMTSGGFTAYAYVSEK